MTNGEFQTIVAALGAMKNFGLQSVHQWNHEFLFEFWHPEHGRVPWYLNLNSVQPILVPAPTAWTWPYKKSKRPTPQLQFIKAHLVGRQVQDVQWDPCHGRVLKLMFLEKSEPAVAPATMELRLYRGGQNMMLVAVAERGSKPFKELNLEKPQELKPLEWRDDGPGRALEELSAHYLPGPPRGGGSRAGSAASAPSAADAARKKTIQRLEKTLQKVKAELEKKRSEPLLAVAQHLETHRSLDVPPEWAQYVDGRQTLRQNIDRLHQKRKQLAEKAKATAARVRVLEKELSEAQLLAAAASPQSESPHNAFTQNESDVTVTTKTELPAEPRFPFRTLQLPSGHSLWVGRNARENLATLRAASAWDLWFHLRDHPGSHGVFRRAKNENPSDPALRSALDHFIRENFKQKASGKVGDVFDVLVTEVRFVKPIKGDKLGRVTYQNEKVVRHRFALP
jgi:hypothetical protein